MSAPKRVAHAAKTIRACWEQGIDTDPQTEAAQALDDTGQLLDPEVAAELVAFRALELGTAEGRVSAKCEDSAHPVWLRTLDDLRGCPWCRVAELELANAGLEARLHDAAMTRTWRNEDGKSFVFVEDIAPALLGLESKSESCPCPPEIPPAPHQVGCFFDGVPVSPPSERPVDGLTATFMPVAAYREGLEDPHDGPLAHRYRVGHDLPEMGGDGHG